MFTILDSVLLIVCAIGALSGCGKEQFPNIALPTPTATQNPTDTSAPPIVVVVATPTPIPTATATPTIQVTYHSLAQTRTPNSVTFPSKHYTATGYCLVYSGKTYCWDDGVKTVFYPSPFNNTGYYTFWGLSCNGSCVNDVATTPTLINLTFTNQVMTGVTVAQVMAGPATTVDCTDDGLGTLECGSFNVDTNQAGL